MLSDESDEEVVEAEVPVRLARRHPTWPRTLTLT